MRMRWVGPSSQATTAAVASAEGLEELAEASVPELDGAVNASKLYYPAMYFVDKDDAESACPIDFYGRRRRLAVPWWWAHSLAIGMAVQIAVGTPLPGARRHLLVGSG